MPPVGYKHSEETRKKMSEAGKRKNAPTAETRKRISESLKRVGSGKWNIGRKHKHRPESIEKMRKPKGEKSQYWLGDKVSYSQLHKWVSRELGKPNHCAYCQDQSKPHRSYQWANISHSYKRDLSDWIRLCGKCHKAYDQGKINLHINE